MENHDTSDTLKPACPSCGYLLSDDDMNDCGEDLWALAPNEERACVTCPNCDTEYWVRGGYIPTYTSALAEEEL